MWSQATYQKNTGARTKVASLSEDWITNILNVQVNIYYF